MSSWLGIVKDRLKSPARVVEISIAYENLISYCV